MLLQLLLISNNCCCAHHIRCLLTRIQMLSGSAKPNQVGQLPTEPKPEHTAFMHHTWNMLLCQVALIIPKVVSRS